MEIARASSGKRGPKLYVHLISRSLPSVGEVYFNFISLFNRTKKTANFIDSLL